MELDPIVLLAYVSVALNIITMAAAAVAYAAFKVRRHARQRRVDGARGGPAAPADAGGEPLFLRPFTPDDLPPGVFDPRMPPRAEADAAAAR